MGDVAVKNIFDEEKILSITKTKINVCLSCDENYAKYAGVAIASILKNSLVSDELNIFILDGGISNDSKNKISSLKSIKDCEINFVKIDESLFEDYRKIKTHEYLSIAAYYRLKLPSLLPDIDKIIYFDCDMVINNSLKNLFSTQLSDYLIAGVKDINRKMLKKNPNYVNSGMLVFNLAKMREVDLEHKFLCWTKENAHKIKKGDQTIINEVCKGKIKILSDEWNVQSSNFTNRSSYTNYPKIVHFVAGKKPWHFGSFSYHKDLYFKYLELTPWKLNEDQKDYWYKKNKIASLIGYVKYRPLFMLRPRFYEALYKTYFKRFFEPKKPIIKNNTFLLWEPCSKSHSEVLPGYAKYLSDLGYHVSVLLNPEHIKDGLFSRFDDKNISLNKLNRHDVKKFFKKDPLKDVEGVLVTTVGKLCDSIHYKDCYKSFSKNIDKSKIFFVEHEVKHSADMGLRNKDLITLRKLNYKDVSSVVVNPNYFGNIQVLPKNKITNFVMIGAIKDYKRDNNLIIDSVSKLIDKGYRNFGITVIGKGNLKHLPEKIQKYFDIKGRLSFSKMYEELERADFLLTSYDEENPMHIRYNTTGTSGNFQLVLGFNLPCVLIKSFAKINGFDNSNSILYNSNSDYIKALENAINMKDEDYKNMQLNLDKLRKEIYNSSLKNLNDLILKGGIYE